MRASETIRIARSRAGLTQAELGARVGTTQSAIARLERGANEPSWEHVRRLVSACGFELQVTIGEPDPELAALRRNLSLSYDERMQQLTSMANFVIAGREAMKTSKRRRG